MTQQNLTAAQLLAAYWLHGIDKHNSPEPPKTRLRAFARARSLPVADSVFEEAAEHLEAELLNGDVGLWVVRLCFRGHPYFIWNFMIDAMQMAETDENLQMIAAQLPEFLLAHYGSLIPLFERHARDDQRFRRMLTGVWRHRMSDNVWMRLRAIQAEVPDPLPSMLSLDHGVDHKADTMSPEDRRTDDKGRFKLNADGEWEVPKR